MSAWPSIVWRERLTFPFPSLLDSRTAAVERQQVHCPCFLLVLCSFVVVGGAGLWKQRKTPSLQPGILSEATLVQLSSAKLLYSSTFVLELTNVDNSGANSRIENKVYLCSWTQTRT